MKVYPLSFKNNIQYVRNKRIFEYDMESAGYSLTISEKLITDEKILFDLKRASKKQKQIILGLYARQNKEFVSALNDAFRKYITAFITLNNIKESNLLFIKKDSVTFFSSPTITKTKFKKARFTKREEFTSFLVIDKLEFYYNGKTNKRLLKGIKLDDYSGTLVEEIFKLMKLAEFGSKSSIEQRLKEIRSAYINKELQDSYYRELSTMNGYRLTSDLNNNRVYSTYPLELGDGFFDDININYNYINILLPLFELFI